MHLDAALGVKAGGDIVARGAIRVGEGLESEGAIRAGDGFGVFAGLCVQREEWETSARVSAEERPVGMVSGYWVGAPAFVRDRADVVVNALEAEHAS
jgi:hypothetical protein